ncbi:unnamed protein product [Psylliodes chrysocephalus]|uniref:Uncharacterized protein n=1 Tax=Psylliodes chrysocephalus TaxID=3402493 RepID=A0A9P0GH67_9CUCU|nr:unnamed protein product [Psylliodes chrysocephala]
MVEYINNCISYRSKKSDKKRGGRQFHVSSDRRKRLKTEQLRNNTFVTILSYATEIGLRGSHAFKVLHEITNTSPKHVSKYRAAYKKSPRQATYVRGNAIAVLVDTKLSRHQYPIIRSTPEKFPSYKIVQAAKKECYPRLENIKITSTCAEVSLQSLLNHTLERFLSIVEPVKSSLKTD